VTALRPGDPVGERYRVALHLGDGARGSVHDAEDLELKERVALKVMHPTAEPLPEMRARLERAVAGVRRVTHDNVCRPLEVAALRGPDGEERVAIAMELLRGPTLRFHLATAGPLPLLEVRTIAEQIARGLEVLHAAGVAHGALHTGNVLLVSSARGTRVVLTDAAMAEDTPENDLRVLGAVLYEMATGERPAWPPVPPSRLRRELTPEWDAVILRCMSDDPRQRFRDPAALVRSLHAAEAGARRRRATRGRAMGFVLIAAVLVAAGAAAALLLR
jgi:serine/threonine-protein kinase